jgi:hypothetical protein
MDATNYTPDYNAVSLTDFKKNPGAYLRNSEDIPIAIFKYNHIAGWVLTNLSFQNILERNRSLAADIRELSDLITRIAPGLLELVKLTPPGSDRAPLKPKWPIFGIDRGRKPRPNFTDERLAEAMAFGQAYVDSLSGRHRVLPDDDVEDEWG